MHQLRAAWRDPGLYEHTPKSGDARNPKRTIAVALQPGACQGGSASCMRLLGSTREKEVLGSGGRRVVRLSRTTDRNRSWSCASRIAGYVCQFVAYVVREAAIVDRVGMESEARNTGLE